MKTSSAFDANAIRAEFPALSLQSGARRTIFFDNAAGTQVAARAVERIRDYLLTSNANTHGVFDTSLRSDALIEECREAVADFLGASDRREVAFGPNMTTHTQSFARAFGRTLKPGDEIITTRLEHEANVSPWLALEERGATVRFVDLCAADVTLDLESLSRQLSGRTRLVAVGYASNAFGTINPVARIARMAHEAGAICFVDAVHFSPHGPIDVKDLDCDVLAYSPYKSFGPHLGVLWGRREWMDALPAYHLRTVAPVMPDKFESGTQNHEGIAGTLGALEYLESLCPTPGGSRRERLHQAMEAVQAYERELSKRLQQTFDRLAGVRVHGITDQARFGERVPTFAITVEGRSPREIAESLAREGINAWHGNYYALDPMVRLGLEERGGAVRISLVHYNLPEEIDRLEEALARVAR